VARAATEGDADKAEIRVLCSKNACLLFVHLGAVVLCARAPCRPCASMSPRDDLKIHSSGSEGVIRVLHSSSVSC
jgi:hypothetical protein